MTTKPLKSKRERNPQKTRAKLLQATIDLVGEKGIEALSLKEAAFRANVSRGSAYLHFDDRDQLLKEAKTWISERLQEGVKRFDSKAPLHDRTFHTTKLILDNLEASKLLIMAALTGQDLDPHHPLNKLVSKLLRELRTHNTVREDIDLEVTTYIMLGSIAATIMLGEQHRGGDMRDLAERLTKEWNRILREGLFQRTSARSTRSPVASSAFKRASKPAAHRG